jgi:hypothetical protein
MWFCRICKKSSCNANGTGSSECPKFFFAGDWPNCADCHEDEEDEDEEDEDEEDEDEEE